MTTLLASCPCARAARQRPVWLGRRDATNTSQACRPLNAEDPADLDFLCSRAASRAPVAAWKRHCLHFLEKQFTGVPVNSPLPGRQLSLKWDLLFVLTHLQHTLSSSHACLEFDSTLGFAGEGPLRRGPRESDAERARRCAGIGELPEGRPIAPTTDSARKRLLQQLDHWVLLEGRSRLGELVTSLPLDASALNDLLSDCGRFLWRSGQAYWTYSETLNAVTSKRRELRPLLGRAWDVAWTWRTVEPIGHNFAFPKEVVGAAVCLALCWGWPRTATLIAAAWGGPLRPAEFLLASRSAIVLPTDELDNART